VTKYFIGIDLSDITRDPPRPSARAVLNVVNHKLHCQFDEWEKSQGPLALVPSYVKGSDFILAIDGPQGLAGDQSCNMRVAERKLATPGKSPYLPPTLPSNFPYASFVWGAVKLFFSLSEDYGNLFRLYGAQSVKRSQANLIEVYPGKGWLCLKEPSITLPKKKSLDGRKCRYALLERLDIKFPHKFTIERPPCHDQLDAALAAYTAYLFESEGTCDKGKAPWKDKDFLREGIIVQPHPQISIHRKDTR